ncbi:MAG: HD domain-containing protein [Armatimonadetes bacterium]|nr:HD domain-containing protein [Armatimonadota bacterium]MBX3109395.1 HD domain-containing protein [Fimbriimonadaceae bacterium]
MSGSIRGLMGHAAVALVRDAVRGTPFQGRVYLVGGAVRDALLGIPAKNDLDLVTEGDAEELASVIRAHDRKNVGSPQTFARFGTAMVMVAGTPVELVTARRESYSPESRKPETQPATLLEDALRRDFTVNALLLEIQNGEVVDLLGSGLADLSDRILRTPRDSAGTFHDDPLRMLRAVRFRHQLGFNFAPGLAEAIQSESFRLGVISQERIRDEFAKMLLGPFPAKALDDLSRLGLLSSWAPELEAMHGVSQGKWHTADVWGHTLQVVDNAAATGQAGGDRLILLLAALLHDVAKPVTRSVDANGDIRFFGHESVGSKMAAELCLRWRFSSGQASDVSLLVGSHMRLSGIKELTKPAARRIARDLGPQLENWFLLLDADANALKEGVRRLDLGAVRQQITELQTSESDSGWQSPLSGKEIMELTGIDPGPEVGRLKAEIERLVLDGVITPGDREGAKDALRRIISNGG